MAVMIIRLASTPKPMLASRFLPQAFSSKPKFVFSSRIEHDDGHNNNDEDADIRGAVREDLLHRPAVGRR